MKKIFEENGSKMALGGEKRQQQPKPCLMDFKKFPNRA